MAAAHPSLTPNGPTGGLLEAQPTSTYGSLRSSPRPNSSRRSSRPASSSLVPSTTSEEPTGISLHKRQINPHSLKSTVRLLIIAAFCSFFFALAVLIGGLVSESVSLIVHSAALLGIYARVLFLIYVVKTADSSTARLSTFRAHKWDLFLCIAAIILLIFVLGGALYAALEDAVWNVYEIKSTVTLLVFACLSVAYAIGIYCVISYSAKTLQTPSVVVKTTKKRNVFSDALLFAKERGLLLKRSLKHVETDPQVLLMVWFVVQSVALLAEAIAIFVLDKATVIDTIFAFVFAPLSVACTILILRDLLDLLMEGILRGLDFSEIAESLLNIDGVVAVRHLRIWSLSMDKVSVSVTLAIDAANEPEAVLKVVTASLRGRFDVSYFETTGAQAQ